jgi:hemerythrin-like domain-containing protein
MIDSRLNNRLRIIEKHLDLALDQLKEENNDGAKYLIYNALSTVGQLQEIVEYEEQKAFRLKRREGEEPEG